MQQADIERKQQLEHLEATDQLEPEMKPYLEWLRGNRKEQTFENQQRACELIRELTKTMSLSEIAGYTDASEATLQRLSAGDHRSITDGYSRAFYFQLKKHFNN